MRELKFRVWDAKANTFIYPYGIGIVNRKWFDTYGDDIKTDLLTVYSDDTDVYMFTGLKDKDGTDIYEGDILKYIPDRSKDGKVIYESDRGGYIVEGTYNYRTDHRFNLDCDFAFESEVIGNIFDK